MSTFLSRHTPLFRASVIGSDMVWIHTDSTSSCGEPRTRPEPASPGEPRLKTTRQPRDRTPRGGGQVTDKPSTSSKQGVFRILELIYSSRPSITGDSCVAMVVDQTSGDSGAVTQARDLIPPSSDQDVSSHRADRRVESLQSASNILHLNTWGTAATCRSQQTSQTPRDISLSKLQVSFGDGLACLQTEATEARKDGVGVGAVWLYSCVGSPGIREARIKTLLHICAYPIHSAF
jgi:hypothetical protein